MNIKKILFTDQFEIQLKPATRPNLSHGEWQHITLSIDDMDVIGWYLKDYVYFELKIDGYKLKWFQIPKRFLDVFTANVKWRYGTKK